MIISSNNDIISYIPKESIMKATVTFGERVVNIKIYYLNGNSETISLRIDDISEKLRIKLFRILDDYFSSRMSVLKITEDNIYLNKFIGGEDVILKMREEVY